MIRALSLSLIMGSTLVLGPAVVFAQQDEDPKALYADLFGDQEKSVSSSRSFDDDLEFAGTLLETASTLEDAKEFQLLLFEKVVELSEKRPEGYEMALEALATLSEQDSANLPKWERKTLTLWEKRYRTASSADRQSVTDEAMTVFIGIGEQRLQRGDANGAREAWREAMSLASRLRDTETREMLKNRMSDLTRVAKLNEKITELKAAILEGNASEAQARELSLIYLLDLNNPKEAELYLGFSQDKDLISAFELLTGKIEEEQAPATWLKAGQVFEKLSNEQESKMAEAVAVSYALAGYNHYLDNAEAKDINVLKARVAKRRLDERMEQLSKSLGSVTVSSASSVGKLGKRVDLIKVGMFGRLNGHQAYTLDERGNILTNKQGRTTTRFPVNPKGDYTITIEATKLAPNNNGLTLLLPVADGKLLTIFFDGWNGSADGFGRAQTGREWRIFNREKDRTPIAQMNRKFVFQVKVRQGKDKLAVQALFNGKELFAEEDAPRDLHPVNQDRAAKTDEIHVSSRVEFRISKFELVMDSGKAEYSEAYQELAKVKKMELGKTQPVKGQAGFGSVGINGQLGYDGGSNGKVRVEGKSVENALSVHAAPGNRATVDYELGGAFKKFSGIVGFNDSARNADTRPAVFTVIGDGKELWKSKPVNKDGFEKFEIDVSKVNLLQLRVQSQGSNNASHTLWINPVITK